MRLAIAVSILMLMASSADAAPGDAEMAAWYSRWTDGNGRITMEFEPDVFNSYRKYERIALGELWFISQTYPGTTAAHDALWLREFWWVLPRGFGKRATP